MTKNFRQIASGKVIVSRYDGVVLHMLSFLLLLSGFAFSTAHGEHSFCQNLTASPTLTQFVDPLPIPPTIDVSTGVQVTLGAYKITQKLHSELPATTLYAYGTSEKTASLPGPTLEATRHKPAHIRFENHIPDSETFLITDTTIHWANPARGGVPIVTHLHGAEAPSDSDGHPDGWFTARGETGHKFVTQNYTYPNSQVAATLWYHDHTVGITRNNVLAGLAGFYIIRSPSEEPRNLPSGRFEVPLMIQDKQLWTNGSINFPDVGDSPDNHPNWCPEYFGDIMLVNGVAWPHLDVYRAKYRFRIVNAANARFLTLSLSEPSLQFIQIGTDGGFLPFPMYLDNLTMAPGYRTDVIVDFSRLPVGTAVYLNNSAPAPFPSGDPDFSPPSTNSVMAFRVVREPAGFRIPQFAVPRTMGPMPVPSYDSKSVMRRSLTLVENDDADGNPLGAVLNNHTWMDPVTETPKVGSVEIWEIINFTPDAHPIHIHLIQFLFLNQQAFNQTAHDAGDCTLDEDFPHPESCFVESPQRPDLTQVGWKDTVIVWPSKVTRLWIKWTPRDGLPFPFNPVSGPGYVWHCHILDHEDNDMMRPLAMLY
ncbi:hypothetical protein AXG93_2506s1070 [Marchantia polymorpha subsp. ruderalis]|uniref:Plastocyanin-like domain-containing protein n=1 Tax=Marchantia polymorpha subsp. ruderalis TaxID=1480154 RepID=A0A176VXY4_MARPO|nr:hypothetical protein AXG93_2506s1070 [Marchantia polymorpha subsp. ruderalis]